MDEQAPLIAYIIYEPPAHRYSLLSLIPKGDVEGVPPGLLQGCSVLQAHQTPCRSVESAVHTVRTILKEFTKEHFIACGVLRGKSIFPPPFSPQCGENACDDAFYQIGGLRPVTETPVPKAVVAAALHSLEGASLQYFRGRQLTLT